MGDATAGTPAPAAPAPAGNGSAPPTWYTGVEPEIIGHWQNRSLDLADPKSVAIEMTKAHKQAERFIGVPSQQLIRLPTDVKDEAGWKDVWTRLGVPAEAKDYDFKDVKLNGKDLDQGFAETMRQTLLAAKVAKDNAPAVVKAVVKIQEDQAAAATAERAAKIEEENTKLRANWGTNYNFNLLKAQEGARMSQIPEEAVQAMENAVGKAAVMEHFRKIGMLTGEHPFHESGTAGTPGGAMTQEAAAARLQELLPSLPAPQTEFGKKLQSGDPAAIREWNNLSRLATGIMETT